MPIDLQCGQCQKRYRVDDQLAGKKVKCKACGFVMSVPAGDEFGERGPVELGVAGLSKPVAKPRPAARPFADADSFEAVAAKAAMEDAGSTEEQAVPPIRSGGDRGTSRRSRNNDTSKFAGRRAGSALFIIVMGLMRSQGYGPLQGYRAMLSVEYIGVVLVVVGSIVGLLALVAAGVAASRDEAADWDMLKAPALRGLFGVALAIGGIVLMQHPYRFLSPPKSTVATKPPIELPVADSTVPATPATADPVPIATAPSKDPATQKAPIAADPQAPPGMRLTADGKPIPPPPVDIAADPAPALSDAAEGSNLRGRRPAAVPSILKILEPPNFGEVLEMRAPGIASPWIFTKRKGVGGDLWERYNTAENADTWKPSGHVQLSEGGSTMIFGPSGEYIARQGNTGGATIEVWSLSDGQLVQSIDGTGMTGLLGFINRDQFVVAGAGRGMLVVVSAKTGQKVRDMFAPRGTSFNGRECSISPDGSTVAMPVRGGESPPAVMLYNTGGGRRISLPGLDKDRSRWFFVSPEASAFSRDGKKLAVAVQNQQISSIHIIRVAEGRVLSTLEYPDLNASLRHLNGGTPLLQWLSDTDCLLLRDSVVIDSATGRVVGCTDRDVSFWRDLDGGRMLIKHKLAAFDERLDLCSIDTVLLKDRLAAAKSTGPMRFDWPEVAPAKFATISVPKTGEGKPGAPPDSPPPPEKAVESPIAIEPASHRVGKVFFSRSGPPVTVLAMVPRDTGTADGDPLSDTDFRLSRIDLSTGIAAPSVVLPVVSHLLAISPDASLAVIGSDAGDRLLRKPKARLNLIALPLGKVVTTFVPYAGVIVPAAPDSAAGANGEPVEKVTPQTVTWADMPDADGLVTLSGGHLLVRWSLAMHQAVWARTNIMGTPVLSPRGKYIVVRQENSLLLLDSKTGDAAGSLSPEPLAGAEVTTMRFSGDGKYLYAGTSNGLFSWDVATGQTGNPLTTEHFKDLEDLDGTHLLLDDRVLDVRQKAFVYKYPVNGGQHLSDGPAGRHWYVARSPINGSSYLCSAAIPSPAHLANAVKFAASPSLIRPGTQVVLQVNAGGATESITKMLAAKLKARGLDQGDVVATLRVTANESPTGEEKAFGKGMSHFQKDPNVEKVMMQKYECYYELVDAKDHILYGSQTQMIRHAPNLSGLMLRKDETAASKLEELLVRQVASWAEGIQVPSYLSADGQLVPRPETVLGVQSSDGSTSKP